MAIADNILSIASSQLGVQEIPRGSNCGPDVEKYLKSIGLGKGYAWCAAFVYWVVQEASTKSGVKNKLIRSGWVPTMWQQKALRTTNPRPGDIFIINGAVHIGIVREVRADSIVTIEGNSNDEGSAEGYEVCSLVRKKSQILGYLTVA